MSAIPEPLPAGSHRAPPSGTVTFAFTDIEGSTQRWERNAAAMQDAVRRHDALMRAAIGAHGGHVFKTIGDAFCAAFRRPEDAVAAMLDAQRALGAQDFAAVGGLRVRAAIHTGTADERDDDYFGPTVNRIARLVAIGHGGQVLLSGATRDMVRDALPADVILHDLGEHRLKDLARAEHVYQMLAPGLDAEFAPLRSLDALSHNLPLQLTSFVGREAEIAEITELLGTHRLVTLVGSGGVGKTRASLQVAANLLDASGDGVWFIELAPLASGEYIPTTVAQALGITLASQGDPVENLVRALKAKNMLLVVDNCEHLLEPAARVLSAILRGCPKVKILASSRQGLGIAGEMTYRMPSLAVPNETDAATFDADDAALCTATALFIERARAVDHRFLPDDENAPAIAEICRRLDGIPLAIELAAARVKLLRPRQLRERLDERFRVLTGGSRDVLPRQQTLRALIDWSHDLLDERERVLFRRLGIFVNGFTLEGAVAVASGDGLDELDIFDLLASLVDKSLVLAEPDGDALRYRLLESTRVYAREKLATDGELETCSGRHLRSLRERFAQVWEHQERTGRMTEIQDLFAAEIDDVRAALDGALARPDVRCGGELLAAIDASWRAQGLEGEGSARLEAFAAALAGGDPALLSRLWAALAGIATHSGRKTWGLQAANEALRLARASGDRAILGRALLEYAESAVGAGRFDEAEAALTEAEAIPGPSARLRLNLLSRRAKLSSLRGDLSGAARAFEQLRKENRALGNLQVERVDVLNLAEIEHERGATPQAVALVREILPAARADPEHLMLAIALANLAGYLVAVHDLPAARDAAREAIRALAPRDPQSPFIAISAEHLALALALAGDLSRAARLAGYADAAFLRLGFKREFTESKTHGRLTTLLDERLAPEDRERLLAEGAALVPEDAIPLALDVP